MIKFHRHEMTSVLFMHSFSHVMDYPSDSLLLHVIIGVSVLGHECVL